MTSLKRYTCNAILGGLCLVAANGAYAQIGSINSGVVTHLFNDIPGATVSPVNSYPGSILLSESGVSKPAPGGINRDIWQFSNNGTTAYQFQNGDYFNASFNLVLTANSLTVRREAGFLFATATSGDIQFIVNTDGHEVVQFGGVSFYSFFNTAPPVGGYGMTYNSGDTITLGLSYFLNGGTGNNAVQFFANGNASPVFDFAPGVGIGNGSTLGGYFQIGNDPANPLNSGSADFGNISIVPEPSTFALVGMGMLGLLAIRRKP